MGYGVYRRRWDVNQSLRPVPPVFRQLTVNITLDHIGPVGTLYAASLSSFVFTELIFRQEVRADSALAFRQEVD